MKKFYFTFGPSHYNKGLSLHNFYTFIEAEFMSNARDIMWRLRGSRWSTSYLQEEFSYGSGWEYIPFDDLEDIVTENNMNVGTVNLDKLKEGAQADPLEGYGINAHKDKEGVMCRQEDTILWQFKSIGGLAPRQSRESVRGEASSVRTNMQISCKSLSINH